MKLFAILLCIAVANASAIVKEKAAEINKRGLIYVFTSQKNYTIFEDGMTSLDSHWNYDLHSKDIENFNINNTSSEITVDLKKGSGFTIDNDELESGYGILHFEFKITHPPPMATAPINLNIVSYDGADSIQQNKIAYTAMGEYQAVDQPIMNYAKNTFIEKIKRFSLQNVDYEEQNYFTLYLKNIRYEDIKYEQLKHDSTLSFIDSENCALSSNWKDVSENPGNTEFNKVGDKCVMTITTSADEPVMYQLTNDKFFTSAQLNMIGKSKNGDEVEFVWFVANSEDSTIPETEVNPIDLKGTYENRESIDFESEKKFNIIKIKPYDSENAIELEFTDFKVGIITAASTVATFEVKEPEGPLVILDETGLHWNDASWGSTNCNFVKINEEMQCTLEGAWPAFSFQDNSWALSGGTLVVTMKVANPDQPVQIQIHYKVTANYQNIASFSASSEYRDEKFQIPDITENGIDRFAIQEASQQKNTFYIKKIVYFPTGYTNIPESIEDFHYEGPTDGDNNPDDDEEGDKKSEEDKYQDNGYKVCVKNTKIAYADGNGIYGKQGGKWCAILQTNLSCWANLYGYECCTGNIEGAWGEEKGEKCGNPAPSACWASEMDYECCTIKESEKGIVFVDESGAWGVKNNKWCGIK